MPSDHGFVTLLSRECLYSGNSGVRYSLSGIMYSWWQGGSHGSYTGFVRGSNSRFNATEPVTESPVTASDSP